MISHIWEYFNQCITTHPLIQSIITIFAVSISSIYKLIYYKIYPNKKPSIKLYYNKFVLELQSLLYEYEYHFQYYFQKYENKFDTIDLNAANLFIKIFNNIKNKTQLNLKFIKDKKELQESYNNFKIQHESLSKYVKIGLGVVDLEDPKNEYEQERLKMIENIKLLKSKCIPDD